MKLALHCANPRLGDVEANVATVAKAVGAKEAEVVVFPEMFLTGYAIGDDAQRLAFTPDDERLAPLLAACRKARTHAIVGLPRTPRAGITHNSAVLVAPDGTLQWYDKRCLATFTTFQEGLFFAPGHESPVWETAHGRIGIHVCYDLFFPEHQRAQALAGADILLNISASPAPSRPFFQTLLQARAIENACFSAYTNNVGAQDALVFWGGAQAVGPRGQLLGALAPYEEGRLVVDLDLADLAAAREFRPTLRDGAVGTMPGEPDGRGQTGDEGRGGGEAVIHTLRALSSPSRTSGTRRAAATKGRHGKAATAPRNARVAKPGKR